ncbi:MAG: gamma-glutamyl-gamma-aminobutyrate hydrolase family protein [Clostridiales bacterium]|nr:gamma-glutamyl-gamma-aminobutyrate hydrolase family protein [Candidatus Coliplasma caballi]
MEQTKKKRILISGSGDSPEYVAAIERAGGIAVAGHLPEDDGNFDGLLLAGGCDVDPARYGETVNGAGKPDPERDALELALIKSFEKQGKPIFGICRGMQIFNVALGGTLIQDLPQTPEHHSSERKVFHEVETVPGSKIAELFGAKFVSNSFHHEAADRLGAGFRVTAKSVPDGVAEAIEHESKPWFAVQFHPERMTPDVPEAADAGVLFSYFLSLCK